MQSLAQPIKARAPAKLIVSGEHAVVYGNPALAIALDCYAESMISNKQTTGIGFQLVNIPYIKELSLQTLLTLKQRLQKDYGRFLQGKCSLSEVLTTPFELLQYTVMILLEQLRTPLRRGMQIQNASYIPIGCGLGSSAASIMSTLLALQHFFKLSLTAAELLALAKESENLQHGRSSGVDLHMSLHGGFAYFTAGKMASRASSRAPLYLVLTGTPLSNTGECVESVRHILTQGSLLKDFEAVTNYIDVAFQSNNIPAIEQGIHANHELLVALNVVPQRVQSFIKKLNAIDAVAKVCGAGAVRGENAGALLVVSQTPMALLKKITDSFGYTIQKITIDNLGARLV